MSNNVRTALALQGGGALGAYEYGVIKALYETRPNFKPAVVTGISIGAINAAVLAGAKEDPVQTLDLIWREKFTVLEPLFSLSQPMEQFVSPLAQQYLSLLGNQSMYHLRPEYLYTPFLAPFYTTSFYDTSPLYETLAEVIDLKKLNRSEETRVVLTAVNIATGELAEFDNKDKGGLSIDHILASGSIPPGFPMTKINGECYWDGGLHSNTPLRPAINCLEACDGGSSEVKRELIVVELIPMEGKVPGNMLEVTNRLSQLLFTSKLTLDKKLFNRFNAFIRFMEKIEPFIPAELRNDPGYQELKKHKKIDMFRLITFPVAKSELARPTDFSKATIAKRIEAGYQDAIQQRIWEYNDVTLPESEAAPATKREQRILEGNGLKRGLAD